MNDKKNKKKNKNMDSKNDKKGPYHGHISSKENEEFLRNLAKDRREDM